MIKDVEVSAFFECFLLSICCLSIRLSFCLCQTKPAKRQPKEMLFLNPTTPKPYYMIDPKSVYSPDNCQIPQEHFDPKWPFDYFLDKVSSLFMTH